MSKPRAVHILRITHPDPVLLRIGSQPLPLDQPKWTPGAAPGEGTVAPVVFEIGAGLSTLTVRIEASNVDPAATYALAGEHGGVSFSGSVRGAALGAGPVDVDVVIAHEPERFEAVGGDFAWTLEADAGRADAGHTTLELYWVPTGFCTLVTQGINVSALRVLARTPAGMHLPLLDRMRDHVRVALATEVVFRRNPPRYDVWQGAPSFVDGPGIDDGQFDGLTLHLTRYLKAHEDPQATCNCYDQAAVLQFLLRSLGVPGVRYGFFWRFGYLARTNLVGRGNTNNPLHRLNGEDLPLVIDEVAQNRTWFGNHAFCFVEDTETIADATAGPHIGHQSAEEYLAAAVDPRTPPQPGSEPGTTRTVRYYTGVTSVDMLAPLSPTAQPTSEIAATVGMGAVASPGGGPGGVVVDWPDPRTCPALGDPWSVAHDETLLGPREAHRMWRLQNGGAQVTVAIYVAADGAAIARRRFEIIGSAHSSPAPIFTRSTDGLGDFGAEFHRAGRSRLLWTFQNVTFDVQGIHDPSAVAPDLGAIKRWLQGLAEKAVVPDLAPHLPVIHQISVSATSIRVGDQVDVEVQHSAGAPALVEPRHDGEALRLLASAGGKLTFRAVRAGDSLLPLLVAHPGTLLVAGGATTLRAR